MSPTEQKIIALFSPLPFSQKAKVVAVLSQILAAEAEESDDEFLQENLEVSQKVRKWVSEGKMDVLSEDEFWANLKSL